MAMEAGLDTEMRIALNGIIGDEKSDVFWLYLENQPSQRAIELLSQRLEYLNRPLVLEVPEEVAGALERVFAVMPSQGADPAIRCRVYLEELSDLCAWSVVKVLPRFIRGEIGSGRFAPSIAEIREHAERFEVPLRKERQKISRVLNFWGTDYCNDSNIRVITKA